MICWPYRWGLNDQPLISRKMAIDAHLTDDDCHFQASLKLLLLSRANEYVCVCFREGYNVKEGLVEVWRGAGELRKPGGWRIETWNSIRGFQLNRPGLQMLLEACLIEKWMSTLPYSHVQFSKSSAPPVSSWNSSILSLNTSRLGEKSHSMHFFFLSLFSILPHEVEHSGHEDYVDILKDTVKKSFNRLNFKVINTSLPGDLWCTITMAIFIKCF